MQRLLFTALACLISASVFGQTIPLKHLNPDINERNQRTISLTYGTFNPEDYLSGGLYYEMVKPLSQRINKREDIIRYNFLKLNYVVIEGSGFIGDLIWEEYVMLSGGVGGLKSINLKNQFDWSFGVGIPILIKHGGAFSMFATHELGNPSPTFTIGMRRLFKNEFMIRYGVGFPELMHFGIGKSF